MSLTKSIDTQINEYFVRWSNYTERQKWQLTRQAYFVQCLEAYLDNAPDSRPLLEKYDILSLYEHWEEYGPDACNPENEEEMQGLIEDYLYYQEQ